MNIELFPLMSIVIVTTFTPGPNNISSTSMGMSYGYKKNLRYLIGIVSGFFLVMMVCAFLASTLLRILPVAERYLRWIGAAYIAWLAIGILRSNHSLSDSREAAGAFTRGFVLQLFNPKVAVYGLTLYSTFLAAISNHVPYLFLSAMVFALIGFTDVLDVDDVCVVHPVGGARLAEHPGAQVSLAPQVGADQLDRHHSVDQHVAGPIHDTHASLADAGLQPISAGDDPTQ